MSNYRRGLQSVPKLQHCSDPGEDGINKNPRNCRSEQSAKKIKQAKQDTRHPFLWKGGRVPHAWGQRCAIQNKYQSWGGRGGGGCRLSLHTKAGVSSHQTTKIHNKGRGGGAGSVLNPQNSAEIANNQHCSEKSAQMTENCCAWRGGRHLQPKTALKWRKFSTAVETVHS